jgi:oligopeptidase A
LGADERLYAKYKQVQVSTLDSAQKQALRNALRNFVLGGAELQGESKVRYAAIQERLAELSQKFSENALDATDKFALYVMAEDLEGVPEDVKTTAREAAEKEGQEGYKLSLKMPCYLPIMQFAKRSELRQKLYTAYVTRASDQCNSEFAELDNSKNIQEILQLRQEEAKLLGYQNYAEVSVATKMADSPNKVIGFLRDLAQRAKPYALQDLEDMRQFAAKELNLKDPQAWDWPYIGEKLKEARYSFSEQEVKQYFTAPKVLQGLFKIIETLFDVSIRLDQAPVWHPAVSFYRIERQGQLVGQFYLDPPARSGKRGGAWMDDVRARWLRPDSQQLQTPVAHLVCNFADSVDGKPPLLTHDDVITLFHEFGHGLHHMLTKVNERDVSGISGVEWDAVELPSQFMENFCWEWSVLRHMTAHVETGEPLPQTLFDKMVAAKNFQSGLQTLRQIEFGLLDMLLHSEHNPNDDFMPVLNQVRAEVAVIQPPSFNRMAHTFSHIFAGGYAAGYYSYKWAEVLSADAYAAFEETALSDGSPNPDTGRRYLEAILEAGGSRPALESFVAFRGREPSLNALLRHQGMDSSAVSNRQ